MSLDLFQNMQEIVDSLTDDLKEFDVKESILDTKHLNSISTFEEKPIKRLGDLHKIWNVLDEFKEDIYICGGYARWMCSPIIIPVIPNDIDIYCKTMDIYNRVKTKLKDFVVAKHVNDVSTTYFRPNNSSSPLFGLKELQSRKNCIYGFSLIICSVSSSDRLSTCFMIRLPIIHLALVEGVPCLSENLEMYIFTRASQGR